MIKSYHIVSQFLPLDEKYEEASNTEIIRMLDKPIFHCPKKNYIAYNCSRSLRRYFSKTKSYGIIDELTLDDVERIVSYGKDMGTEIGTEEGKIIFPDEEESDMKDTLIAVNGDFYRKHGDGEVNEAMTSRPKS